MSDTEPTVDGTKAAPQTPAIREIRGHERATMRMLRVAVRERWPVEPMLREAALTQVATIMLSGRTERERLRAIEVLVAMDRDNIAALATLDKVERLEGGEVTDRIELLPIRIGVR